jgi:hypothetical protein
MLLLLVGSVSFRVLIFESTFLIQGDVGPHVQPYHIWILIVFEPKQT